MNLDKKSILVICATVLSFSLYNYYLQSKYPDYFAGKMAESVQGDAEVNSPKLVSEDSPSVVLDHKTQASVNDIQVKKLSEQELTVETEGRVVVFDQKSSSIRSILLKNYKQDQGSNAPVELLDSPLLIQGSIDPMGDPLSSFAASREGNSIVFKKKQGNFLVSQKISVPLEGYGLDVAISFENQSSSQENLTSVALFQQSLNLPQESGGFGPSAFMARNKAMIYGVDGTREEELAKDYCEDEDAQSIRVEGEKLDFIGFDMHYFLSVLQPESSMNFSMSRVGGVPRTTQCPLSLVAFQKQGLVDPGKKITLKFKGFFGPKDLNILESHSPKLAGTVRFGWFSILAKPLLMAVKAVHSVAHNFGLAIIIVTVFLKLLFYPLTRSAAVSMKRMQKFNPEMTRIKEKYKADPQRQQKELMTFMAKHKINPAKGCLPILPQIPVFIAFYNVLSQAIELRHAPFFGWITDLASADPYYVTPLLLGVGMFIQQKLTPNPSLDKNQEKIMLMMPVIFTVMMLSLPAGMVLYMIANTAVSIAQQQWLNRRLEKHLG